MCSIYALVYQEGQNVEDQFDSAMSIDDTGYVIQVLVDETELRQLADEVGIPLATFKEPSPARPRNWMGSLIPALLLTALIVWALWRIVLN